MSEFDLHHCFLFEGIDEQFIDEFISSGELVDLHQGEFLFHQNDTGDAMYIIVSGELQVLLDADDTEDHLQTQVVGVLKGGALIGELCVFGQQKRSASIAALVDSQLLKIEGEDFRARIYTKELDTLLICYNIAKLLSERLTSTDALLRHSH